MEYAQGIEKLMGEELGYLTHITDWAGKLAGDIARIAGLLHIMRFHRGAPEKSPIGTVDMQSAISIGRCLINHALKVFDMTDSDSPEQIAKTILSWIHREHKERFSSRDFLRAKRGFDKKSFEGGAAVLIDHEILRKSMIQGEKGRPSEVYSVNPYLWDSKDKKDKDSILSLSSQLSSKNTNNGEYGE